MLDTQKRNISPEDLRAMAPSDLIEIGRAKYKKDVLPLIPHVKVGMMVVMDIASGDYEIDIRGADARTRLSDRRPDAVPHMERVGYRTPVQAVSMRRPKRPAADD